MSRHGLGDPPAVALARRAAAELGLRDPKAWREGDGRWLVSGFDAEGRLRLFHPLGRGWEELTVEEVEG